MHKIPEDSMTNVVAAELRRRYYSRRGILITTEWDDLPLYRQDKWRKIARDAGQLFGVFSAE